MNKALCIWSKTDKEILTAKEYKSRYFLKYDEVLPNDLVCLECHKHLTFVYASNHYREPLFRHDYGNCGGNK